MLCTGKATYALKHVETTNTLYMVPGSDTGGQVDSDRVCVKATAAAHLELTQMAPQLRELDAILRVRPSKQAAALSSTPSLHISHCGSRIIHVHPPK